MRRSNPWILSLLGATLGLAACATPPIVLAPRYTVGDVRTYRLLADVTTTLRAGETTRAERSVLDARARVQVVEREADETTLRLTVTPRRFTVDGRASDPPPEQEVDVVVGPDGTLRRVVAAGGLPAEPTGADVEELAPVLGVPLPLERVRLGERWVREIPGVEVDRGDGIAQPSRPGRQRGRVAALRRVSGYDCAIVRLSTERPVSRARLLGDQPVTLAGTEYSSTDVALAFRRGFAVRIETRSEARLEALSQGVSGADVTIAGKTTLTLLSER